MPDEIKTNDNTQEIRETVEVLDVNGETLNRNDTPLADIFNRIEKGKAEGKSADQVIKEAPVKREVPAAAPVEKKDVKPVEKQVEKPIEKPAEKKEATDLESKLNETQKAKTDKEEEVTRAKLNADLEAKPADKNKEAVKPEDARKEDEAPEDELQVLPHDKPKTVARIKTLLSRIASANSEVTKTKAEAKEKADKLAELEKKLTEVKTVDPKTEEAVQKQLEELSMFRRRYDLEKDPETKTKFDSRIELAETAIEHTLKKQGANEALLNLIKEEGGWNKFSGSNRVIPIAHGKTTTAAELADSILQELPLVERKAVESSMVEQIQTKRDKDRYFLEEQAKANDFFKKKEEATVKQQQEYDNQVKQIAGTIETWHKKVLAEDWLKEREIPANATAEQKAAIEEDNKYTKQLQAFSNKLLKPKGIDDSLEMAYDALKYYQERREKSKVIAENVKLKADLAAKQAEIDKFKGGSRSIPKAGSIVHGGSANVEKKEQPRSLEDAFAMIERGEDPNSKE